MGHYNEFYEKEMQRREQQLQADDIRAMSRMDNILEDMSHVLGHFDNNNMKTALKTIHNEYVIWQHNNDYLVRDPKIIIDVLKDDK